MDVLFNMQKIRFATLDNLFQNHNRHIYNDSTVHVFINMESILRKVTSGKIDDHIKANRDGEKDFISNIFNIAAHYRLYFNKSRINSKIYLYMGHSFKAKYRNEEYIDNYREPYNMKFTKDTNGKYVGNMVNNTIETIKTIFTYIEGVYFLSSDYLEPSVIPKVISSSFGEKDYGLIITTDPYDYQYVNHKFDVIRAKGNNSYYVNDTNVIQILKKEYKVVTKETCPSIYTPFILSFLDDRLRNIKGIPRVGVGTVIKSIHNGISQGLISDSSFNFNMLNPIINDTIIDQLRLNFLCVDVQSQYQLATSSMIAPILDQLQDLFDESSLKKINENYFTNNPMMIMEIQPLINKPKKNIFGV